MNRWPMVPLAQVAKPITRPIQVEAGLAYRTIGVKWWGEGAYERQTIDGSETAAKSLSLVCEGDLIINKIWVRHGSTAVATKAVDGCAASNEFPTFQLDHVHACPRWIHWLTKMKWFWGQCDALSMGTSGKNRIKPEKFLTISIPLPPLAEQRRLVERIDALAAKIEEAKRLRQVADQKCVRLLIGMAHRNDLSLAQKTAQGWKEMFLGEVISLRAEGASVRSDENYPNLGIYSFGRGLFKKPPIEGMTTSAKTLFRVSAVQFIYSRLFAFEGAYGVVTQEYDNHFVSNEYPTFDLDRTLIQPSFLQAYFKSPRIWGEIAAGSKGLGDRRQRVHPNQVLAHRLSIPPIEWQNRIAQIQDQLDAVAASRNQVSVELDAMLPAILDQAFRGEL